MKFLYIGTLVLSVFITGCSTLPPVQQLSLDKGSIQSQKKSIKIGIISREVSEASVALPGADCLLCIAFASAANSSLSSHFKTLSSDLPDLDNMLLSILKKQNLNVSLISENFDFDQAAKIDVTKEQHLAARRDFRPLAKQHNLTHIIVFDIKGHGAVRNYSSYIATSPPYASVRGNVYMIDINTNQYVWNKNIDQRLNAQGQWDVPPTYPKLTNAYYSVIETVKESVLEAFDLEKIK
jgi:hypothetical protein